MPTGEFTRAMLAGIPQVGRYDSWKVSNEEIRAQNRRDFRNERVFSIDPLGSQDIDDAMSVKILPTKK